MKATLYYILTLILLAVGIPSFAESTNDTAIYERIQECEYVSLADAYEQIGAIESTNPEVQEFQMLLSNLRVCVGTFVQLPSEDSSGKIYTADVSFYFEKGTPYCSIQYTGYAGKLGDAAVQVSEGEGYLFESFPEGEFFSNIQEFSIKFAPDQLHIQWADGLCEYLLVRGTEEQLASANKEPSFIETSSYATLIQTIDKTFSGMDHYCHYEEENKTLTVYIECGPGYKNTLINHAASLQDQWQDVLNSVLSFSEDVDSALTFATRKSLADYSQAQFTIIFVEKLNQKYDEDTYLAVITDGIITYNVIAEKPKEKTSTNGFTSSKSSTIGENNALRQAKLYLEVMPFSFKGLIEQLEYEGYSYSESVYGATNCGANWYEQAAKSASNYLELMPFSRSDLIDQLEYDGYTHDQAVYGVDRNGY